MPASRLLLTALSLALAMASSSYALADPRPHAGATVFGGSLAIAVPTGDLQKVTGVGVGGFMHVRRFLSTSVGVSGTFGVLYHLEKNNTQLTEVPLLVGLNYYLGPERGLLLFAQTGIVNLRSSVELEIARLTDNEIKFGAQLGAGVALGAGVLRASVFAPSLPDVGDGFLVMGSYELSIVEN